MVIITIPNPIMKNMTKDENLDCNYKNRGRRYKLKFVATINPRSIFKLTHKSMLEKCAKVLKM